MGSDVPGVYDLGYTMYIRGVGAYTEGSASEILMSKSGEDAVSIGESVVCSRRVMVPVTEEERQKITALLDAVSLEDFQVLSGRFDDSVLSKPRYADLYMVKDGKVRSILSFVSGLDGSGNVKQCITVRSLNAEGSTAAVLLPGSTSAELEELMELVDSAYYDPGHESVNAMVNVSFDAGTGLTADGQDMWLPRSSSMQLLNLLESLMLDAEKGEAVKEDFDVTVDIMGQSFMIDTAKGTVARESGGVTWLAAVSREDSELIKVYLFWAK